MSLIRALGNIAEATAVSFTHRHLDKQAQMAKKGGRRTTKKKKEGCTPCAALQRLDKTRKDLGFTQS